MRRLECMGLLVVSLFVVPRAARAQDGLQPPANAESVATLQLPIVKSRPRALVPLQLTFAATQALDYVTTTRALASGAGREANPVVRGIAGNRPAFAAVKAATTAGIILVSEKMWKRNRAGAVVMLAIADGVMGAVVAHNARVR